MQHFGYNLYDHQIQLRLVGIVAIAVALVCLGIIEMAPSARVGHRVGSIILLVLCLLAIGIILSTLGSAA